MIEDKRRYVREENISYIDYVREEIHINTKISFFPTAVVSCPFVGNLIVSVSGVSFSQFCSVLVRSCLLFSFFFKALCLYCRCRYYSKSYFRLCFEKSLLVLQLKKKSSRNEVPKRFLPFSGFSFPFISAQLICPSRFLRSIVSKESEISLVFYALIHTLKPLSVSFCYKLPIILQI